MDRRSRWPPHREEDPVMRIQPSPPTAVLSAPTSGRLVAPSTPFSKVLARPASGATRATTQSTSSSSTSAASGTAGSADTADAQSALDQSQDENLQFLQLQSQVNTQSETFTTLSNVMKTENDTVKNTAANMQI